MEMKKKTYTAEFKQRAVGSYKRSDTTYSAIARESGVYPRGLLRPGPRLPQAAPVGEENIFQMKRESSDIFKRKMRV